MALIYGSRLNPMTCRQTQPKQDFWVILASCFIVFCIMAFFATTVLLLRINHHDQLKLDYQQRHQAELEQHWGKFHASQMFKAEGKYLACVDTLQEISDQFPAYLLVQTLHKECYDPLASQWIQEAVQLANQNQLQAAISKASLAKEGSYAAIAAQYITNWSQQILSVAEKYYQDPNNGFSQAIQMAATIQPNSSVYSKAQDLLNRWQQEWRQNLQHWQTATNALKTGNLIIAAQETKKISVHPFWSGHQAVLFGQIETQQQAYDAIWQQAQQMLDQGKLEQAMSVVMQLPIYHPWNVRKQEVERHVAELRSKQHTVQTANHNYFSLAVLVGSVVCSLLLVQARKV